MKKNDSVHQDIAERKTTKISTQLIIFQVRKMAMNMTTGPEGQ